MMNTPPFAFVFPDFDEGFKQVTEQLTWYIEESQNLAYLMFSGRLTIACLERAMQQIQNELQSLVASHLVLDMRNSYIQMSYDEIAAWADKVLNSSNLLRNFHVAIIAKEAKQRVFAVVNQRFSVRGNVSLHEMPEPALNHIISLSANA